LIEFEHKFIFSKAKRKNGDGDLVSGKSPTRKSKLAAAVEAEKAEY
jgi:hypothetical protein